jgi:hypothetical protein
MTEQCPENYTNLITSVIASVSLIISEVLPFVETLEGNGLVQMIIKKIFPEYKQPILNNV